MGRQVPKNVRQIGNVSDSSKIYVEDYVDTFFNQLCEKADQLPIGAFLVGEIVKEEEEDYIYVCGAIRMKTVGVKGKDIYIDESVWKDACERCKEYFPEAEILGWFLINSGQPLEINHNITKIHEHFFAREESLFVMKDAMDREEKFYIHKFRDLMECGGHYIYYEKNTEMQNYMIASRRKIGVTPSETVEDRAAKDFRSVIKEKMEKGEQKHNSRFVYAASTFLVLVVLVIGVTMINNYDKMKLVQDSLDNISQTVTDTDRQDVRETSGKVETVGETQEGQKTVEEDVRTEKQNEQQDSEAQETLGEDMYIVQKGDTLATISRKAYGDASHVEAICKMNGLEDGNLIFIGQKLLLP